MGSTLCIHHGVHHNTVSRWFYFLFHQSVHSSVVTVRTGGANPLCIYKLHSVQTLHYRMGMLLYLLLEHFRIYFTFAQS